MKKRISLCAVIFIVTSGSFILGQTGEYLKNWHKEEVNHIITKAEAAEYRKLKNIEDQISFIELFWAKRDPTPNTKKNEFKEEYDQRLAHAKGAFRYGYNTGTNTEQGKIYLYFGQAKILQQSPSAQASQRLQSDEVWFYPSQPWMKLPKDSFSVVFSHDGVGYAINHTLTDNRVIQAIYKYTETILLHPGLKELPKYTQISTFEPGSFEGELLEKVQTGDSDLVLVPFEKKNLFIKAENSSSYLTFQYKISPPEELDTSKNVIFFGKIESETFSFSFRKEQPLAAEQDFFVSHLGFPVPAGDYTLSYGFFTQDKQFYSIKTEKITVPNFWDESLALSSILASTEVQERVRRDTSEEHDFFTFGAYSLTPHYNQDYGKDDFLNVFYYIYNMALDEKEECSLTIEFELQFGEQKFPLNPQKRQKKVGAGSVLPEGTRIPVSAIPAAGNYVLVIKVIDELAQKEAIQSLNFIVR
ncbi:MAG: GWxTD domain-containing protein [Candidatus Aminicenantes bacterium]|nr:GWxTD domain-containing protein [Candidatus Aminicenantes bacterium]